MRKGWRNIDLGSCAEIITGFPFKSSDYADECNGVRLLRGDNVIQNRVRWDDACYWSKDRLEDVAVYQMRENDIVIALDRTWVKAGLKAATLTSADLPCLLVQRVARLRATKVVEQHFLSQIIQSHRFAQMAQSQKTETAIPHISPNDLRNFVIALPPLSEQRKIAEILRTWDDAIEKMEAVVKLKLEQRDRLRRGLIAKSERGGRPSCFSDFLSESREPGTDGATARKITVRLYGKGIAERTEQVKGSANTRYYRRGAGQLIYSKLDFLNGAFAIVPPELDGFQTTLDLPCFEVASIANPRWVLEYLTRPSFYTRQVHLARGQRKARRIAPEDFLAIELRLPTRKVQDRIVDILEEADREVNLERQALRLLQQQKRGLMQKLLTGEWRVRV